MSSSAERLAEATPPAPSRFAGTLLDVLDRVEYSRVQMDVLDNPIYRLRYEAYRREESVPFNDTGTVHDDLDTAPNVFCYGVYIEGELVSSLRVHHLTSDCRISPSMRTFPEVLGPPLNRGQSFIDPSRFTADYEASLAYPALPFLTLRIAVMATEYFHTSACLALVRREHGAFYRRVFGAVPLTEARAYNGLAFPVMLFSSVATNTRPYIYQRYPFFRSTDEERQKLFGSSADAQDWVQATPRAALEEMTSA